MSEPVLHPPCFLQRHEVSRALSVPDAFEQGHVVRKSGVGHVPCDLLNRDR